MTKQCLHQVAKLMCTWLGVIRSPMPASKTPQTKISPQANMPVRHNPHSRICGTRRKPPYKCDRKQIKTCTSTVTINHLGLQHQSHNCCESPAIFHRLDDRCKNNLLQNRRRLQSSTPPNFQLWCTAMFVWETKVWISSLLPSRPMLICNKGLSVLRNKTYTNNEKSSKQQCA